MSLTPLRLILAAGLILSGCIESSEPVVAKGINFGTDAGEYPRDGECDDPRFAGSGMARVLDTANTGRDGTDCANLFTAGLIRFARTRSQVSPSECRGLDFGDNSSDWARDGECDDPRFTGPGIARVMVPEDLRADAADCSALCSAGQVWIK